MKKEKCNVEVFSRVTGFYRPVQSWNKGKTEEFKNRKTYCLQNKTEKQDNKETKNNNCNFSECIA